MPSVESTHAATAPVVRKTALNAVHRQMGAKMVDFNGWDMPVEYPAAIGGGIINEHMAVRTGVGIFDVSHMGDIRLAGRQALDAVQHISMNDASRLAVGQAQYSALLYPQGTFVDDVIVHRLGEDEYLLVINAGTREKDFNWVRDNTREFDCAVENLSDDFTQIAIQGPKGVNVLQKLTDADLSAVREFGMRFCVRAKNSALSLAAWARATLCASKANYHSTDTKFPIRLMFGKPGSTASVRWKRQSSSVGLRWGMPRPQASSGLWLAWR